MDELSPEDSSMAVEVDSLVKTYGRSDDTITAVNGVSFGIERGSVVGILGPNGAGKTTLIKSILRLVIPTSGTVRLNGIDAATAGHRMYDHVAALLEGARNIYWRLTVRENLRYFTGLQGIDSRSNRSEQMELLDRLNIADRTDDPVRELSRGMKQKAALACVLSRRTPILFLDEPTLGLDVGASHDLRSELASLAATADRTILLSSHNMDVIEELCDRVIIMNDGEIIADDAVNALIDLFRIQACRVVLSSSGDSSLQSQLERSFESVVWNEQREKTEIEILFQDPDDVYLLMRTLNDTGAVIDSVSTVEPDLEEVFLRITNDERGETLVTGGIR